MRTPARPSAAAGALATLTLCVAALVTAAPLAAQSFPEKCGTGIPPKEGAGYTPLPRGDVFCQLVADPKSPRSFVTIVHEQLDSGATNSGRIASVGIGDVFPLGRWAGAKVGDGTQVSLSAGVFAQFDLGTKSYDLLNADYMIGIPVTWRHGRNSARVRLYHQSSHLGDEYLLREPADKRDRVNLSFESLEAIVSRDLGGLRAYAGGEYLINREPSDLSRLLVHAGAELRPESFILPLKRLGGFRFIAATDVKSSNEHGWRPAISARTGFEYDKAENGEPAARRWSLLLEFYDGPSPYGQFYKERLRYTGLGVHFSGF